MPSPKSLVTMYGVSTKWLVAPETRLIVPKFIKEEDEVPGNLAFYVNRPEAVTSGGPFVVDDYIQLYGHMSKIERTIPGFHSPRKIRLQHPLEMSQPIYLRCVEVGNETAVSWTVGHLRYS